MTLRFVSRLATGLLFLLAASSARAQLPGKVETRPLHVVWQAGVPRVSYSARDFADAKVQKKLQNGLPQTLVVRVYAFRERGDDPIAVSAQSCRVVYDLWEGVFRIARQTEQSDKTLSAKSMEGVLSQCLQGQNVPLGDASTWDEQRGKPVYFAVMAELNPLSRDTVQRIRRWLARPSGNQLDGNAFFGSFVSIFVSRRMGEAEKTLAFRSGSAVVPPLP